MPLTKLWTSASFDFDASSHRAHVVHSGTRRLRVRRGLVCSARMISQHLGLWLVSSTPGSREGDCSAEAPFFIFDI